MSFPLILLLLVISSGGAGMLGLLELWQHKVQIQLELDQCASDLGIELRKTQERIEKLNLVLLAGRAAGAPPATLEATVLLQEALLKRWDLRRTAQIARSQCPVDPVHLAEFIRPLEWRRPPRDPLGPAPLIWEGAEIRMRLARSGRRTHVAVRKENSAWIASFRPGAD